MKDTRDIIKDYTWIESTIKKIYSSGLRTQIFLSLNGKPKRIRDICNALNCKPQNASTRIKELQDMFLVEYKKEGYVLTVMGEIIKHKTLELNAESIGYIIDKDYEKIESAIKKIYTSCLRTKIFISLNKKPKRLCDIYAVVSCKPQNASAVIKELLEMLLVENTGEGYALTVWGEIIKHKTLEIIKILNTFKKHDNWWMSHIIEIPDEFLYELGALSNSEIIGSDVDILSAHNEHIAVIKKARELKVITPVFYSDFVEALFERTKKGLKTELVITPEIVRYISTIMLKENSKLIDIFKSKNISVAKMKNGLKMGLTLTEKTMMLGLYKFDNTYDFFSHFKSSDRNAVGWGNKLFNYFRKNSKIIKLKEFGI